MVTQGCYCYTVTKKQNKSWLDSWHKISKNSNLRKEVGIAMKSKETSS